MTDLAPVRAAVAALAVSFATAGDLDKAYPLQLTALRTQSSALMDSIDALLAGEDALLDAGDLTVNVTQLADAFAGLQAASDDEVVLCDLRGLVGRASFNISKVTS